MTQYNADYFFKKGYTIENIKKIADTLYIEIENIEDTTCSECGGKAEIQDKKVGNEVYFIKICTECNYSEEV